MLVPESFAELFDGPAVELDRGCLVIADAVRADEIDLGHQLDRLDDLAGRLPEPTLDGLTRCLFDEMGFQGNAGDYFDPKNSYLDVVLDRRRGIPITLSVLCIEVGRRAGVPLVGVGMPGHFLVRDQVDQSLFLDPYRRGARLGEADCAELFRRIQGPSATFDRAMLDPVDGTQILTRILANLRHAFLSTGDRTGLARVLSLMCGLPEVDEVVVAEAVAVLTAVGQFDQAAEATERLAAIDPGRSSEHRARAERLRARLN